jgi:4-carboxymuconolactone decarboxylase
MTTSPMPYPHLDLLPAELRDAVTRRGSIKIYRMVTHSPGLAPSFLSMATDMFLQNSLPATWRELAILRVGYRYQAPYEVHHHVNIARAVGLRDADIRAAESGDTSVLPDAERTLLRLTDLLLDNHGLTDDGRAEALSILTVDQLAAFVLTVGFYQLVSNFLNTFGITTDGEPGAGS